MVLVVVFVAIVLAAMTCGTKMLLDRRERRRERRDRERARASATPPEGSRLNEVALDGYTIVQVGSHHVESGDQHMQENRGQE